jgi:hypothetical protein
VPTLTVWASFGAGFVVAPVLPSPVVARLSGLRELPIDSHLSGKLQFRPVLTRELPLNTFGGWNMKKLLGIALAGMLISTAACGPKAQAGGDTTKIAPPGWWRCSCWWCSCWWRSCWHGPSGQSRLGPSSRRLGLGCGAAHSGYIGQGCAVFFARGEMPRLPGPDCPAVPWLATVLHPVYRLSHADS